MRIGVISSVAATLDSFFVPLVEEWQKEGHGVVLGSGSEAQHFDSDVIRGLTRRPSPRNLFAHKQLTDWALDNQIDVILTSTAVSSALARFPRMDVPVVYFCHGLHWNEGNTMEDRVWQTIENALLRNTTAVLCMNSNDLKWFSERLPADRILYLENGVGVPLDQYEPSPLPQTDILQLLWAGEFSARKRPELMMEIAAKLRVLGVNFRLTMLGKGPLHEEMVAKSQQMGLADNISMPGHRPIQDYFKNCHLFVHTSLWEGLPRVMLEARVMQRQSIAFDTKGSRDIPDVVLAADGDIDDFAAKVEEFGQRIISGAHILSPASPEMDSAEVARTISRFLEGTIG